MAIRVETNDRAVNAMCIAETKMDAVSSGAKPNID